MPNYNNSIIYQIKSIDPKITACYVGATTNYKCRKNAHKRDSMKNQKLKLYRFIRNNGGWEKFRMTPIARVSCADKMDLNMKTDEYIEKYKSILHE